MACGAIRVRNVDPRETGFKEVRGFEMWIWRRMENISWTEHKTNQEVLENIGEERKLIETIRTRQQRWIGHTLRGDTLLLVVLEGKIQGKHTRGRPRKSYSTGCGMEKKATSMTD